MNYSSVPVTMQQIIVFLQVVECRGFAKAGACLHMTQSAVSKSIQKMEQNLHITLFTRTTRKLELTEAGELLYKEWKPHFEAIQAGYQKALDIQKNNISTLHIGLLNTARPDRYFWEIQQNFQLVWPEISLNLESEYMTDLIESLASGFYDAVMVPDFERFTVSSHSLVWKWAARSNARLIVPEGHPLSEKGSVHMQEILEYDFISLHGAETSDYLRDLSERFSPYHTVPNITCHFTNAYDIKYLYRPEGYLIFTDKYFDMTEENNYTSIPIDDEYNGIICAYSPENKNINLKHFLDTLPDLPNIQ